MKKTVKQHSTLRALALAAISLCMTFVVGTLTTVALFYTERNSNTPHIQAGSLDAEAWLIGLSGTEVDSETGKLVPVANTNPISLKFDEASIFKIPTAVPGLSQTATILVQKTTAFNTAVTFEIVDLKDGNGNAIVKDSASEALSEQIKINIVGYSDSSLSNKCAEKQFMLSDCAASGNSVEVEGIHSDLYFVVTATFVNDADNNAINNNAAQGGSVSFDITIKIEQNT